MDDDEGDDKGVRESSIFYLSFSLLSWWNSSSYIVLLSSSICISMFQSMTMYYHNHSYSYCIVMLVA